MLKKWLSGVSLAVCFSLVQVPCYVAQETSSQQSTTEQQEKAQKALEEKAVVMLDQLIADAQGLKLPENRVRIQIAAGDMLWQRNEGRARSLFTWAATTLNEMTATVNATSPRQPMGQRQGFNNFGPGRGSTAQLRQELVLTVARHSSSLAYQILQTTQQQNLATTPASQPGRQPNMDANLEQRLTAEIAKTDPQLALQNAESWLEKGQYPNAIAQVLAQLQIKDKDAAMKFSEKVVKQLQSENLLTKPDASSLAVSLLRTGPRSAEATTDGAKSPTPSTTQFLNESAFRTLLDTVVNAALKASLPPASMQRGGNNFGGRRGGLPAPANATQSQPDSSQIEQAGSRMLLMNLQILLPQIDKYAPMRASAVRQKLTQSGIDNNPRFAFNQISDLVEQGTSESLLSAATTAPGGMQPGLYQQAAMKAIEEGNPDRARQIANDHLNPAQRNAINQMVNAAQLAQKSGDDSIEGIRQALAQLPTDEERLKLLLQLANSSQKDNPKLAVKFLTEAQKYVAPRAASYQQFDDQIKLAQAFAPLDVTHSFEVLEPGINQLNELLPAAALLSGFEINIFREGELPLREGSRLSNTISQYAEVLADLAKRDFDRAQNMADRFQLAEARILARLAISRSILGGEAVSDNNRFGNRGFGPNAPFWRQ
jgi:hypothetical protein